MMRKFLRGGMIVVLTLAGCQSEPVAAPPVPRTPPAVDGPIRKEVGPVAAIDIYPLQAAKQTHHYVDGRRKGQIFTWRFERGTDNTWNDVDEGMHTMVIREKDGAILVVREEDSDEKVRIEYDPPLELLPAKLEVGKPRETKCRMSVYDLATGNLREEGDCVHVVEYLGRQKRRIAAGEVDACRTRAVRRMQLKLAQVEVVIEVAAVPGQGKIWSRIERDTRALGLFSVKSAEEMNRSP